MPGLPAAAPERLVAARGYGTAVNGRAGSVARLPATRSIYNSSAAPRLRSRGRCRAAGMTKKIEIVEADARDIEEVMTVMNLAFDPRNA